MDKREHQPKTKNIGDVKSNGYNDLYPIISDNRLKINSATNLAMKVDPH